MKIFVSHDVEDAPLAVALKTYLEGIFLNASVFVSGRDLVGGEVWIESLRQTLAEATAVVALITRRARTNQWVLFEAGAGFPSRRTIPIAVGMSFDELGPPLGLLQARALDEEGLETLACDVARLAGLRTPVRFPGVDVVLDEAAEFLKRTATTALDPTSSLPRGTRDWASTSDPITPITNVSPDPQLSELIANIKTRARDLLRRGLARQRASFDVPPDSELAGLEIPDLVQLSEVVGFTLPFGLNTALFLLDIRDPLPNDAPSWKKIKQRKDLDSYSSQLDELENALAN